MDSKTLRSKYIKFFTDHGHTEIPPAPLIPENDPTTLFTGSGMQPLVPYLLGEEHPSGTRLVDSQPSFRAEDIEEVGDNRHTTFFEMLGNWSLGDYFKAEQLPWFWTFLTQELGIDPQRLYVTVFSGDPDNQLSSDQESIDIWKQLYKDTGLDAQYVEIGTEENGGKVGMQGGRIFGYEAKKNWWSRSGTPDNMPAGEPGGGDSEVFYEFTDIQHDPAFGEHCHPNCDCGRFLEIGNSVFMEYLKQEDGTFTNLPAQNVDFGGGLERILAVVNHTDDVFATDLFQPIIKQIETITDQKYADHQLPMRVIADHMRAATIMVVQGLQPSNKQQGYFLRRVIRRSVVKMRQITGQLPSVDEFNQIVTAALSIYDGVYCHADIDAPAVTDIISTEISKFSKSLDKGLKQLHKFEPQDIDGTIAFDLFQTYGFPFEITQELVTEQGGSVSLDQFNAAKIEHAQLSRTASAGMFKGGLADHSENVLKYHTATHLLHAALRNVLGDHVAQKGSNLTGERLRFDFSHDAKLTDDQVTQVIDWVNAQIDADLPVSYEIKPYTQAIADGALAFFGEKYPQDVKVYSIGVGEDRISQELCGGPHVETTSQIGHLELYKQESSGAGTRRVYLRFKQ